MSSRCILFVSCLVVAALTANTALAEPPKPKDGPLGMKFVPLPKATFYMGWGGGNRFNDKGVKTEIKEDFEIAIYTVTQGQWQEVMDNNPSFHSRDGIGKDIVKDIKDEDLKQFPVEQVSWEDAQEFIKKLNEKEKGKGYRYRLPTSAEWEYACRGGATSEEDCSYHFFFDKPTNHLSSKQANIRVEKGPSLGRTTTVGSYSPNKLGLYDMHGNVWQWTSTKSTEGWIFRGGCWNLSDWFARAGFENHYEPWRRDSTGGVRLARVPVREQDK